MAKIIAQGFTTLTKLDETIQIKLSNDISAISCYSDGTPKLGSFTTADTYVEGFRGSSKIPANELTIGKLIPSKGVEAEAIGNRIFINNLTEASGYVDIPVSIRGNFLGVYRFNAVKQIDGMEAASLKIVGENVFKYSETNEVSPKEIFLSAIVQNIENPTFKWSYRDSNGSFQPIGVDKYGALLLDSRSRRLLDKNDRALYTSSGTIKIPHEDSLMWGDRTSLVIRCSVTDSLYDDFTITKIKDGSEAYTVVLTNENHSFSSNYLGNIASPITVTTDVVCYKGVEEITPTSISILTAKQAGLEWRISGKTITFTALKGSELKASGEVEIKVVLDNKVNINKVFTWNKIKDGQNGTNGTDGLPGAPGENGDPGIGYSININGGNRGIAYSAIGTNPEPSTAGTFTVELLKNGVVTEPNSVRWISGGNFRGTANNTKTFSPQVSTTYNQTSTYVHVEVRESGAKIEQTIPIVCTKHAGGLDWIEDWDSNSVVVDNKGKKIISPRIFAGTKEGSTITGVALGKDTLNLTGVSPQTGLVGYKKNLPVFALTDKADFYVSSKGNAGSVVNGTANGLYFDGDKLYLTGALKIQKGSTVGSSNTDIDDIVSSVNKFPTSVKSVVVEYAVNTSHSQVPDRGWGTGTPQWKEGQFVWSRNKTTLMNGTETYSSPICLTGQAGATGIGIASTKVEYAAGASGTSAPNTGWQLTIPNVPSTQFLWTRTTITYTAGSPSVSYSVSRIGENGSTGVGISKTEITYQASSNGQTAPGESGWSSSIPSVPPNQFLWTRTKSFYTDGKTSTAYSVSKIGVNGQSVVAIVELYQMNSSKSQLPTPTSDSGWSTTPPSWEQGKYIHTCSKITYANPSKVEYTKPMCNSTWEAVNGVVVGGRNLAQKTSNDYSNPYSSFTGADNICPIVGDVLTDGLMVGDKVTVKIEYNYSNVIGVSGREPTAYIQGAGNVTQWSSGAFTSGPRAEIRGSGTKIMTYNFTVTKEQLQNQHWIITIRHDGVQRGEVKWRRFKVEKGNKATDWTPAPEDIQSGIDKAQSDATLAKNTIAEYSKDNVVTPVEKKGLRLIIEDIKIKKPKLVDQANALGVSVSTINSTYDALISYTNSILSNVNTNSEINRIDFNSKFNAWYIAENDLIKAIQIKLKDKVNKTVVRVDVEYASHTSATSAPSGGWNTSPPQWTPGKYIWSRNVNVLTDGTRTSATQPVCITGNPGLSGANGSKGETGEKGDGVKSITPLYKMLDTKTQQNTPSNDSGWSIVPPTWSQGKYIHTCSKITYTSGRVEYTKPVCDSSWEAVNEIEIGGRNLLRGTKPLTPIENNSYPTGTFQLCTAPAENDEYTIQIKGELAKGSSYWGVYNSGGSVEMVALGRETKNTKGIYTKTFSWKKGSSSNTHVNIYPISHQSGQNSKIEWVKLEKGNKATDWTPSPEEVQEGIDKNTGAIQGAVDAAGNAQTLAQKVSNTIGEITTEINGNTKIKGELIVDGSITGNAIKAGSFTIHNVKEGRDTFSIDANGGVRVDGILESQNFDNYKNTGYRITPDGKAILNQAEIRGDIKLPNAGITNFGAQIGNRNLANKTNQGVTNWRWSLATGSAKASEIVERDIRCVKFVRDSTASTSWSYISFTDIGRSKLQAGKTYTVSVDVKGNRNTKMYMTLQNGDGRESLVQNTNHISYNVSGEWTTLTAVMTLKNPLSSSTAQVLYISSFDSTPSTWYMFKNLKIEEGSVATPWCPAPDDDVNPVRFWAGKSYEYRSTAPFQVKQNGDVVANNVLLNGRMTGMVDSGHLHISNGTLVIDGAHTYMEDGKLFTTEPRAGVEYVRLDSGQCVLNTNVSFGNNNVIYDNSSKDLEFNLRNIRVSSQYMSLRFMNEGDFWDGLHTYGPQNAHHYVGYSSTADKMGTLFFSNQGSSGPEGDYVFTKNYYKEKCSVKIDGDLKIKDSFASSNNKIEMKATSDGWGFFAY